MTKNSHSPRIGLFLLCAAFVLLLYHSTLTYLVTQDWMRQDFDYCFLIPFIIGYLLWEKRQVIAAMPSIPTFAGLAPTALGLVFFLFGELGGEFFIQYLSMWLVICGLCLTALGWAKFKQVFFPLLLILAAFPPPHFIYSKLTMFMQLTSTRLGFELLNIFRIPAFRSGNVIDLGFTQLEVVSACSGLRFLIPIFLVVLLFVYYFRDRWWKRAVLLALAAPVAVILNGVRIFGLAHVARILGSDAVGVGEDVLGWIMFGLSMVIFYWLMRLLARLGSKPEKGSTRDEAAAASASTEPRETKPLWPRLGIGMVSLLAVFAFLQYRSLTPSNTPASNLPPFPAQIGVWSGQKYSLDPQIIETLDLSDYAQVTYHNPAGKSVSFYLAWYASQAKGESIHSPETCMRGGGWTFEDSQVLELSLSGSPEHQVRLNRSVLKQGDQRSLAYFWFPSRGRDLVNAWELKIFTFWDSLTRRRTDGALVRIITQVYPDETLQAAEERMQGFLGEALPVLATYLPR